MIIRRSEDSIYKRAKLGFPLSMRELALASGHCYAVVKRWKRDGLPLLDKRITLQDALAWRRKIQKEQAAIVPDVYRAPQPEYTSPISQHPLLTAFNKLDPKPIKKVRG
jgi:hypothetical protein